MPGKKHIVPNAKTIYNWLSKDATAQPSWRELAKLRRENRVLNEIIGQLTVKLSLGEKKELG